MRPQAQCMPPRSELHSTHPMIAPAESRTVSVTIHCAPDAAYDYVARIENFPRWSAFARAVQPDGDDWIFTTSAGDVRVRFVPRNDLRVLDHTVTLPDGRPVYVPLRIVANGPHSEVLFTIFRLPEMNDQQFEADVGLVLSDLQSLKRTLENPR